MALKCVNHLEYMSCRYHDGTDSKLIAKGLFTGLPDIEWYLSTLILFSDPKFNKNNKRMFET